MSDEIETYPEFSIVWTTAINDFIRDLRKKPQDEEELFRDMNKIMILKKIYFPKYFSEIPEYDRNNIELKIKPSIFFVISRYITNKNYATKLTNLYNEVFNDDYYSNREQTRYMRKQIDEHLIPDLGNIVESYIDTNDRCQMISENGDRCGYKSEYIKMVDGVNYRENCKHYCSLHCKQSFQKYIDTQPKKVVIDENDVKTQFTVDKWFILYNNILREFSRENSFRDNNACTILKKERSLDIQIFCRVPKNIVINNVNDCKIYFLDSDDNQVRWISTYKWKIKERKQDYIVKLKYTLSYF
jgi:hypothetical protein